jgi:hypothetical protein
MPLVCPWRQGTTDRDVTTRLKFSQPERILLALVFEILDALRQILVLRLRLS